MKKPDKIQIKDNANGTRLIIINGEKYVGRPVQLVLGFYQSTKLGSIIGALDSPLLFGDINLSYNHSLKGTSVLSLNRFSDNNDGTNSFIDNIILENAKIDNITIKNCFFDNITIDTNFDFFTDKLLFVGFELTKHNDSDVPLLVNPVATNEVYVPLAGTPAELATKVSMSELSNFLRDNSYYLNGYVTLSNSIIFGSGDFSVFFEVLPILNTRQILTMGASASFELDIGSDGKLQVFKNGFSVFVKSTSTVNWDVVNFVGYIKIGTTGTYYINNIAVGSITDSNDYTVKQDTVSHSILPVYKIYNSCFFNRGIATSERTDLYNGVAIDPKFIGANNVSVTAGSFTIGKNYRIDTIGTTDFTLAGAISNTVGLEFKATAVGAGTGTATHTGVLVLYDKLKGQKSWLDVSGNGNHASVVASLKHRENTIYEYAFINNDISTIGKVFTIPKDYYISKIVIENLGANTLSTQSFTQETSGLSYAPPMLNTLSKKVYNMDTNIYDVDKTLTYKATGVDASGVKVIIEFKKAL